MKKHLVSIICLMISFSVQAQSNVVKFYPSALTDNIFSVGFEHKLSGNSSIQLNFDYASETDVGFKSRWSGFSGEYRIYGLIPAVNEIKVPEGFFVAPTVALRFFKDIDLDDPGSEYTEHYNFVQAGASAGYQWLPQFKNGKKPLALEASVGLLAGFMVKGDSEDFEDYTLGQRFKTGLVPTFNVGVGFAFGK